MKIEKNETSHNRHISTVIMLMLVSCLTGMVLTTITLSGTIAKGKAKADTYESIANSHKNCATEKEALEGKLKISKDEYNDLNKKYQSELNK